MPTIPLKPPPAAASAAWAARLLTFPWPPASSPMCASSPSWARTSAPSRKPSFDARNIDTRGIERAAGKSFFWEGSYLDNLNEAKTHNTELNVFAAFEPKIPDAYRDSEFLFLANIDPVLQRRVREAMPAREARRRRHHELLDQGPSPAPCLKCSRASTCCSSTTPKPACWPATTTSCRPRARVMALGPQRLVVKHGEYGATLFHESTPKGKSAELAPSVLRPFRLKKSSTPPAQATALPAASSAISPRSPSSTPAAFRRAMFYGSVMGSFCLRALRHRAPAAALARRNRRPLRCSSAS